MAAELSVEEFKATEDEGAIAVALSGDLLHRPSVGTVEQEDDVERGLPKVVFYSQGSNQGDELPSNFLARGAARVGAEAGEELAWQSHGQQSAVGGERHNCVQRKQSGA